MKLIKRILFGLFVVLSLSYLFIVISPKIFKNFYPFGIKAAVVLTGSMEPTISINDFVIMKKPKSIQINDIVSYKDKNTKNEILHRVVKIDHDEITTKGDANNTEDKPIKKSQITGVYIGKIKYIGTIISYLTNPIIFSMTITLIFILMIFPLKEEKNGD